MSKSKRSANSILRNDKNAFLRIKEIDGKFYIQRGEELYVNRAESLQQAKDATELLLCVIAEVLSKNHAIDPADFGKVVEKSFDVLGRAKVS